MQSLRWSPRQSLAAAVAGSPEWTELARPAPPTIVRMRLEQVLVQLVLTLAAPAYVRLVTLQSHIQQ